MIDVWISLGTSPLDEKCVQVSEGLYLDDMKKEAKRYKSLLDHKIDELDKISFRIKTDEHDFGPYLTIDLLYDTDDKESRKQAIYVENNLPLTWEDSSVYKRLDVMI